jgi:hypothetical protein
VHKEAEIRQEKFSFVLIFFVATTVFTWAQLTAQNVPINFMVRNRHRQTNAKWMA